MLPINMQKGSSNSAPSALTSNSTGPTGLPSNSTGPTNLPSNFPTPPAIPGTSNSPSNSNKQKYTCRPEYSTNSDSNLSATSKQLQITSDISQAVIVQPSPAKKRRSSTPVMELCPKKMKLSWDLSPIKEHQEH